MNNLLLVDSLSHGGTSKNISDANSLSPSYRFIGRMILTNNKQEVIWRLFINNNMNPSFLISWRPGLESALLTSVEKDEKLDTRLTSTLDMSGGLMYVHVRDFDMP